MLSASPGPVSVLICPATPRVLRFRLSSEKCSEISYDWSLILKFPIFHCFHFYCPPGAGFFLICLYLRSSIELLGQRDQRKLKPWCIINSRSLIHCPVQRLKILENKGKWVFFFAKELSTGKGKHENGKGKGEPDALRFRFSPPVDSLMLSRPRCRPSSPHCRLGRSQGTPRMARTRRGAGRAEAAPSRLGSRSPCKVLQPPPPAPPPPPCSHLSFLLTPVDPFPCSLPRSRTPKGSRSSTPYPSSAPPAYYSGTPPWPGSPPLAASMSRSPSRALPGTLAAQLSSGLPSQSLGLSGSSTFGSLIRSPSGVLPFAASYVLAAPVSISRSVTLNYDKTIRHWSRNSLSNTKNAASDQILSRTTSSPTPTPAKRGEKGITDLQTDILINLSTLLINLRVNLKTRRLRHCRSKSPINDAIVPPYIQRKILIPLLLQLLLQ